ncbi:unnamed protein product [Trichogramma brassicae]|uniref:Uncharacterized protein n=1 Tax=Trichogramma brassicae TaxID=86971 RepID=A0A6H5IJK6_9HYME|nr:unnamed protein product [Trichogramma brassicae]
MQRLRSAPRAPSVKYDRKRAAALRYSYTQHRLFSLPAKTIFHSHLNSMIDFLIQLIQQPAVDQQPSLRSGRKCRRALPCKRKFMDTIFLNKIFLNYVKQTYFRAGIKKNRIRDSGQKSNARLCELAPSASPRVHNLAGTEVRLSSLVT